MKKAFINYIKKEKYDDIYTPSYAIDPLLDYIPKGITVWECCDHGESEITKKLKEHGCKVISSDKDDNFFLYLPDDFDMIITNPPYSLKNEFLERCYKLGKPFCLLLPITALEGKRRGKLFREYGIELMIFDKRINFINQKKNCWFNKSWFCYKVLPYNLLFRELVKESDIK